MNSEITDDTFLNGALTIKQSKTGYRFSIDSILVANLASIKPRDRILEIGTGCGIISIILAKLHPEVETIFGIDIQKDQVEIAQTNIIENNLEQKIQFFQCDVKDLSLRLTSGPVNVVICNPPHRKADSGRINPNSRIAISRHEIKMTLDDLVCSAGKMLFISGRLIVVYPVERMTDVFIQMRTHNIEPKKLTLIYSDSNSDAIRCMIEGVKGARPGVSVASPLIIYNSDGTYTDIVKRMFSPYDFNCGDR